MIYVFPLLQAFAIGSVLYLICYYLFQIWEPLPTLISWSIIVWLGWMNFPLFSILLFFWLMFISSFIGSFFLALSTPKSSIGAQIGAFAALIPLQILCMQIGSLSHYSNNDSGVQMPYFFSLVLSPNIFAILFCYWKIGIPQSESKRK